MICENSKSGQRDRTLSDKPSASEQSRLFCSISCIMIHSFAARLTLNIKTVALLNTFSSLNNCKGQLPVNPNTRSLSQRSSLTCTRPRSDDCCLFGGSLNIIFMIQSSAGEVTFLQACQLLRIRALLTQWKTIWLFRFRPSEEYVWTFLQQEKIQTLSFTASATVKEKPKNQYCRFM